MPLTEQIGKSLHLTRAGEVVAAASRDILGRLAEMTSALEDLSRRGGGAAQRRGGHDREVLPAEAARQFQTPLPEGAAAAHHRQPRDDAGPDRRQRRRSLHHGPAAGGRGGGSPSRSWKTSSSSLPRRIIALVGRRHVPLGRIAEERRAPARGRARAPGWRSTSCAAPPGSRLVTHMEFDDLEAIKQGVISGLGLAYLPIHAVRLELAAGELAMLDVEGFPLRRRWYALHRQGRRLSNAAQGVSRLSCRPRARRR